MLYVGGLRGNDKTRKTLLNNQSFSSFSLQGVCVVVSFAMNSTVFLSLDGVWLLVFFAMNYRKKTMLRFLSSKESRIHWGVCE